MAIRTSLLNWNVINKDADFSKYIETVSEPWVIEWLQVSSSSVAIWKARVPCERSNGDTIYALVDINAAVSISWDWDVYIKVDSNLINNWELANEDWTEIATIEVWTMPESNALLLATITSWEVEDKRNMIKKVGELNTLIQENASDIDDLDTRVGNLEAESTVNHLEERWIVGEVYNLDDDLYLQKSPLYSDCISDYCAVWDIAGNKQIHIQRIGSGEASNQLKLKIKCVGAPTQNVIVEVRKWVKVETETEAYWYWDEVIASWSIDYSEITTTYAEKTVTLDANFWWTKGELLDVVVRQNNDTVNSTNYYILWCDNSQYSEAMSYVAVDWTTRVRSKLMPYCTSGWFKNELICKVWVFNVVDWNYTDITSNSSSWSTLWTSQAVEHTGTYTVKIKAKVGNINDKWYLLRIDKDSSTWIWAQQIVQTLDLTEFVWRGLYLEAGDNIILKWCYGNGSVTLTCSSIELWLEWNGNYTNVVYYWETFTKNTLYYYTSNFWKLLVKFDLWASTTYATNLYLYKNWNLVYLKSTKDNWTYLSPTIDMQSGDVLSWKWNSTWTNASFYVKNLSISFLWEPVYLTPTEVKEIWEEVSATSFWTVNWEFKGWQFVWETTEVLTGEIVLWNAVWFLTVNYKGSILKIPYYW